MSRGAICLAYTHSQMNLQMCAKLGANRSCRLVAVPEFVLMLVRLLDAMRAVSAKARQNNIYTGVGLDKYNSCPNLTTSTSLTFFTTIFLPFSGALAKVLMVMCRCHGLRVYAVCVCNKVRLPGTGQSAHVIGGSRFTRPASNSRRTLLN